MLFITPSKTLSIPQKSAKQTQKNNKKDTIARGLLVFDAKQKDSADSRIKAEDLEAAKNLILDVLKIETAEPETITTINETEPQISEAKIIDKRKKLTVDQEMNELLAEDRSAGKSYVHKADDRKKYAAS